jgi:hypothetical protein
VDAVAVAVHLGGEIGDSCQRSSSVQLSNAMTMNCGGRLTPACVGTASINDKPTAATNVRAVNSAPRPKANQRSYFIGSRQRIDERPQDLLAEHAEFAAV